MKKVFFVFSICTLLVVKPVWAQNIQSNVCFEKIFIVETGLGSGAFLAKFANHVKDNKFSPRILGVFALQEAEKNGCLKYVSERYRNINSYTDAFLGFNGLVDVREITIDQFLQQGRGDGFYLPYEQSSVR